MSNILLFYSSLFFGFINLLFFLYCERLNKDNKIICPPSLRLLEWLVIIIIFTSLLNHGYSNVYFKWFDRLIVYLYFFLSIMIAYVYKIEVSFYIIFLSILFYYISKKKKDNIYHVLLHLLMTFNNFIYIYSIPFPFLKKE